jgi:hypothetical protein
MTQEDKELLLKDLCARLPYETFIEIIDKDGNVYDEVELGPEHINTARYDESTSIRPYLRPMSSMTEKETYIFRQDILNDVEAMCIHSLGCGKYSVAFTEANDWLNEHHFDFRDLIEKGLALEAPEGMYKIE